MKASCLIAIILSGIGFIAGILLGLQAASQIRFMEILGAALAGLANAGCVWIGFGIYHLIEQRIKTKKILTHVTKR